MNPQQPRKLSLTISIGFLLMLLILLLAYILTGLEAGVARTRLPVLGVVNDFLLTNQLGAPVSLADLRGHVWVADIIFTRCSGPCLKMTRQMKELEEGFPPGSHARLVTLTTDPTFDNPIELAKYAGRFKSNTNRWWFLTGTKKELGALAGGSLKLSAVEIKPSERTSETDLFIHSTIFMIVDKHAQLRGVFETGGDGVDWTIQKRAILSIIKQLEREP